MTWYHLLISSTRNILYSNIQKNEMLILSLREEEEEEDPVAKAEDDFWHVIGLEKKGIDTREKKRQEALMTLNQPTPIPEETNEVIQSEDKEDGKTT